MNKTKVSVIMPIYNAQEYLEETLECLIHQTLKEIEIICINDGSTDGSLNILNKYAAFDCRIKVFDQENSGAGVARNTGLQYATGEYLSILDADDIFEKDMLEAAYRKAKQNEVDICVFKMDRFRENIRYRQPYHWSILRNQLPEFEPFTYKDIRGNIFRTFIGWTWDKLFRREFIFKHRLEFQALRNTNDMFFTFAAFVKAEKISILNRTLVHQRIGLYDSVSVTRERSWDCFYQALLALREELIKMDIYKEVERSYINYALYLSLWYLDTLKASAFQLLYDKLKKEMFHELGISGKERAYFWDQKEYEKYIQINDLNSEQYRVLYGMQFQYSCSFFQTRNMGRCAEPKVSIVIPVYNVERYLVECLNSVVNQTLEDIEIICVNDGSTDQSLELVKQFAAEDKRVVVLDRANGGYGKAVNCGLEIARGEYIGIVEPDDYVERNMYETLYGIANKENLDFVKADFNSFKEINGKREFIYERIAQMDEKLYNRVICPEEYPIVFKLPVYTWSGIYKRSFINENNIRHNESSGASYQDNGFWFQTFCFAKRIYFVNQAFYQYRKDNPNSSIYDKTKVYCMFEEFQYIYNFLNRNPEFKKKYIGYYQFRRYHNYMGDFYKVADEKKLEFVKRFHEEFKESYEKKELREDVFDDGEWDIIQKLINRPMDFYADTYISEEMTQLREQIKLLKDSKSWQVGSAIVYLPKKILGR